MNKVELLKAVEDGYNLLTREETLEEKSFKAGCKYVIDKMFYILKSSEQELNKYKNIIDELKEDIPCLLEIINRNEKDIKVYQDEWIAIKSVENKLKELKGE